MGNDRSRDLKVRCRRSVSANITIITGVTETVTEDAVDVQVTHNKFDLIGHALPTAAIPLTMCSFKEYALVAGALTIDLRALLGLKDESQDANGKKIQGYLVRLPAGNSDLTISSGASNGYDIDDLVVRGSDEADSIAFVYSPEAFGDVDATNKTIDVSGTGTETFKLGLLIG